MLDQIFISIIMTRHPSCFEELDTAPVVALYGEPDVGKTVIANAAMNVLGIESCSFTGMHQKYSEHLVAQPLLIKNFYNRITKYQKLLL